MIPVPHIGVLVTEAQAKDAGLLSAGIVQGHAELVGTLVGDAHHRVDLAFLGAAAQQHGSLLGRVVVGHAQVVGDLENVRRLPFAHLRQAGADVGFVEILVALHDDLADLGFDDVEFDFAVVDLLLRQDDLHRAIAFAGIEFLQRFQRFLHVAEVLALADEGRKDELQPLGRDQRCAVNGEFVDSEARIGRRRRRSGRFRRRRRHGRGRGLCLREDEAQFISRE